MKIGESRCYEFLLNAMTQSLWSLEELNYKVVYNESYDLELIRSRCYNIWMVSVESQEPCV